MREFILNRPKVGLENHTDSQKNRALFLDRDGVINVDTGYVHQPADIVFVDGIFDLCRYARGLGYMIVVVTNQAGIGRGYYTEQAFAELSEWMRQQFLLQATAIDQVYYCPYHPEHGIGQYKQESWDRKPNPGMFEKAIQELHIAAEQSIMIGDKESDIEAALTAGIGLTLLYDSKAAKTKAHQTIGSLLHAPVSITAFHQRTTQ